MKVSANMFDYNLYHLACYEKRLDTDDCGLEKIQQKKKYFRFTKHSIGRDNRTIYMQQTMLGLQH